MEYAVEPCVPRVSEVETLPSEKGANNYQDCRTSGELFELKSQTSDLQER